MYDDQLTQLDNLITTQHRAQQQMREQLNAVDKRFHKVHILLPYKMATHLEKLEKS